jgi:hypothetical protein
MALLVGLVPKFASAVHKIVNGSTTMKKWRTAQISVIVAQKPVGKWPEVRSNRCGLNHDSHGILGDCHWPFQLSLDGQ